MAFISSIKNNHKAGYAKRYLILQKITVHQPVVKKGKGLSSSVARDIVNELKKSRLTRQGSIKWLKNNLR